MMKLDLVRIICLVVLSGHIQVASALTCYSCSDDPNSLFPYDPECGIYSYNNVENTIEDTTPREICYILLKNNGNVQRGKNNNGGKYDDGDCRYGTSFTECYCTGDLCNTDSYCSQCGYPKPTPVATETTTSTTSTTTTTPSTTSEAPTTTLSTTTESSSGGSLTCYNCFDCPSIDQNSTPVVEDEEFLTCVTSVLLNIKDEVVRGGSFDDRQDGECVQFDGVFSCWCTSSLCNGNIVGQMLELMD